MNSRSVSANHRIDKDESSRAVSRGLRTNAGWHHQGEQQQPVAAASALAAAIPSSSFLAQQQGLQERTTKLCISILLVLHNKGEAVQLGSRGIGGVLLGI